MINICVLKTKCNLWCLLASGMLASMIYIMFNPSKSLLIKDFQASLTPEQNKIYVEIIKERMTIYIVGLLIGLLVGFSYLSMQKNNLLRTCIFTVLVLGINIFIYMLVPKSKYMVNYLTNEKQLQKWTNVYKEMQYRRYMGFILGVISYLILAHNLD